MTRSKNLVLQIDLYKLIFLLCDTLCLVMTKHWDSWSMVTTGKNNENLREAMHVIYSIYHITLDMLKGPHV